MAERCNPSTKTTLHSLACATGALLLFFFPLFFFLRTHNNKASGRDEKGKGRPTLLARANTMFHVVVESAEVNAPSRVDCDSDWRPETESVGFATGNPAVETVRGVVRLFRNSAGSRRPVPNSRMLCILAVPSYISASELARFVCGFPSSATAVAAAAAAARSSSSPPSPRIATHTAAAAAAAATTTTATASSTAVVQSPVRYIRLLRDTNSPSRYMAVVMFNAQGPADDFFVSHNGRRFNPLETEAAQIFYVSDIEVIPAFQQSPASPPPNADPSQQQQQQQPVQPRHYDAAPDLTELPTCPVCLERMDAESSGLLTILCNHTFHSECLAQWRDSGCPVCRYALQPLGAESSCESCECTLASELWICLVCGHVGCGRAVRSHALEHSQKTRHTYALNLETKRVWDYVGDNWVHRVVQAKADGKLVEVGCAECCDWKDSDKAVALELEYSRLVQEHLASFERELNSLKREKAKAIAHLERQKAALIDQREKAESAAAELREEARKLRDRAERAEGELEAVEVKLRAATKKLSAAMVRAEELEQINKSLVENQRLWAEKLAATERAHEKAMKEAKAREEELEGQIRDLMFHIDAQQRVGHEADLQQGDLVTVQGPPPPQPGTQRRSPTRRQQQHGRH